ncbi:hypothetical protein [Granulicella arctica]|uniref:Uncharacterized protein n=1 Tax=Granulicella arctica TaxID=940613 RepID=A0A7Y9TL71_9BACT|nr:hypothetical protein [Granulicella arctica]NYF79857.1 hypothetical protein [Granulicella arctica]
MAYASLVLEESLRNGFESIAAFDLAEDGNDIEPKVPDMLGSLTQTQGIDTFRCRIENVDPLDPGVLEVLWCELYVLQILERLV